MEWLRVKALSSNPNTAKKKVYVHIRDFRASIKILIINLFPAISKLFLKSEKKSNH
jgi:hypothetical protein